MRLNKFACILLALLLVLPTGCSGKAAEVKQADFSFNLPEGYSLSDMTDESCNIVSDEGGAIIGGITVTSLKPKLLSNENSTTEIMTYLQNEFHKTDNVEFIALYGGKENPSVTINLTEIADDRAQHRNVIIRTLGHEQPHREPLNDVARLQQRRCGRLVKLAVAVF